MRRRVGNGANGPILTHPAELTANFAATNRPIAAMFLQMKRVLLSTAALGLLLAQPCDAWGPQGHRTIATLALEQLGRKNPAAAAKVKEILAGEAIEDASIWPDDVRTSKQASRSGRFANT